MDLTGIISISGKPGLFKIVAQSKAAVIVEDVENKKRFPAHSRHKISALEDISIYTYEEDVPLKDVYSKLYEHTDGKKAISHKEDAKKLRNELSVFLPDYDEDRVYDSDIKKLFQWFNLLHRAGILKEAIEAEKKKEEEEKKEVKASSEKSTGKSKEAKSEKEGDKKEVKKAPPAKKAAPKKPAAKKTDAKKTSAKKTTTTKSAQKKGK